MITRLGAQTGVVKGSVLLVVRDGVFVWPRTNPAFFLPVSGSGRQEFL